MSKNLLGWLYHPKGHQDQKSFQLKQQKYRKSPTRNTSKRVLKKLFWYVRLDVPRSKRVSFSLSFLPKSSIRKTVFVAQKTFAIRRIFLMLIGSASQCSKLLHTVGYSFYIIASDFLDTSSIKLLTWPWEKRGRLALLLHWACKCHKLQGNNNICIHVQYVYPCIILTSMDKASMLLML